MAHLNSKSSTPTHGTIIHEGHRDYVVSVSFSPDGKSVVSGSLDKSLRIWDAHSPRSICQLLMGHTDRIASAVYSPLGNVIASASPDSTIRLWDAGAGQQIGTPIKSNGRIFNTIAFSPNGELIASDQESGAIRLWNVQSGEAAAKPFKGHSDAVDSVSFSPDGTRIASGSRDWTIRIWDVKRGKTVVGPLEGHGFGVSSVAYSLRGSQIASASLDHTVRTWDARTGTAIGDPLRGHTDEVYSVAFTPNGRYIASGGYDGRVCIWDLRTRRQVDEPFLQPIGTKLPLAFSPCGTHLATGSTDNKVRIWSLLRHNLDIEYDPQDAISDDPEGSRDEAEWSGSDNGMEGIDRHMSVQEMFELLLRHGCTDLALQMNENQHTILVSGGGFGDIWKGKLHNGVGVAIKVWRASLVEHCDYKALKRATREIHYWSKMKHDNVHQLMGVIMFKSQTLGMVSEWMEMGNIHEYLRKNPGANRYMLSLQVASGLAYVHECNMVHGDIKAINVLVSSDGVAKLTDFGLSTMSESSLEFSATSSLQAGSIRWAAPELLSGEVSKSKQSDLYALGMTMLEIFTGDIPYAEVRLDYQLLRVVSQGILPDRPTNDLGDDKRSNWLWDLLVDCWSMDPDARPSAEELVRLFSYIPAPDV